nr:unnamed protein product [Callosobruchus analis]
MYAFAYASANECYLCNSIVTPGCEEKQGKHSNKFDCASQTPLTGEKYDCAKVTYELAGVDRVERTCVEKKFSCKEIEKRYKAQGIEVKECVTCHDNLCNDQ